MLYSYPLWPGTLRYISVIIESARVEKPGKPLASLY